jgi:hypothetical protein
MMGHKKPPARAWARWQESSAEMAVLGDSIPVLQFDLNGVAGDNKPSRVWSGQAGFFEPY